MNAKINATHLLQIQPHRIVADGTVAIQAKLAVLRASLKKATTEEQKTNIQKQIDALESMIQNRTNRPRQI